MEINKMRKTKLIRFLTFSSLIYMFLQPYKITPQNTNLKVDTVQTSETFPLVHNGKSAKILFDSDDAAVVRIAAEALNKDIGLVTGIQPEICEKIEELPKLAIIIGTMKRSRFIESLCKAKKIPADNLRGKWETFLITVVEQPLDKVERALVIAGSDPRGTAFGVFELSKRIGVSPWVWWADIQPRNHKNLYIRKDMIVHGPPSVKYRGIFLNDEDWGLKPWAAKNMDTDIKDIGPKTYARIFELLLRLKANFIWPAMHSCTKAFYYYEDNPKVADQYSIVVGSSHCEPMLRNNVDEWKNNFKEEYGKTPGPWRYDTNENEIHRYWDDRAKESSDYESVYTIGMRGIHDSGMPGPEGEDEKIMLLNKVIADQREILSIRLKKPADEIPQIFCPYKEVLYLYQKGINLPDDVTIVWADDNHGYIRQLSTPKEQRRSGKSGVYYHLSYWGSPSDYLWLSSTSPMLISFEMNKAFEFGATNLWVFNVGDIKPAEAEIEFAMDLAWDISQWPPEKAHHYITHWAARTFGTEFAEQIAQIKYDYYLLAQTGKPEHLDLITFSRNEAEERLKAYQRISKEALELNHKIPSRLKDSYFQLILYPTLSACHMNEKFIYGAMSISPTSDDSKPSAYYADKARYAYSEIQRLTQVYNKKIAGGKWNKIISWHPRNRPVFKMFLTSGSSKQDKVFKEDSTHVVIPAAHFTHQHDRNFGKVHLIKGLGVSGESITILPFSHPSLSEENAIQAPSVEYEVQLPKGQRIVEVLCTPTHKIHEGRDLRYTIYFGDEPPQIVSVHSASKTPEWKKNVIRGYSSGKSSHILEKAGLVNIRIGLLDPGLLISQINIY